MDELAARWNAAQIEYKSKIRTAARNAVYVSSEHEIEDMEQELLIVLWETCAKYDPSRGMNFNSFFWMRAKQKIGMLGDRNKAAKRTADLISLDSALYTEEADTIEAAQPQPSAEQEAILRMDAQSWARRSGLAQHWRKQLARLPA